MQGVIIREVRWLRSGERIASPRIQRWDKNIACRRGAGRDSLVIPTVTEKDVGGEMWLMFLPLYRLRSVNIRPLFAGSSFLPSLPPSFPPPPLPPTRLSLSLFVCLSVCLSISILSHLFCPLSLHPPHSVCLCVSVSPFSLSCPPTLSLSLSVCMYVCLSVSLCLSMSLSVCLSLCLSVCLSVSYTHECF